jgi:hypothetical protein
MTHANFRFASLVKGLKTLALIGAASTFMAACGPRGESHTVDEIFTDAKAGYVSASANLTPDLGTSLKTLSGSLDRLAGIGGGGDARPIAGEIAGTLTTLSAKAGYTARPALAELTNQYRSIANSSGAPMTLGAGNLKLLAARTYSLLTAELTTSRFRL